MPWFKSPDGGVVHVKMSNPRRNRCQCGRLTDLVCDRPVDSKRSGTCDKPVCTSCRRVVGDKDYCPFHRGDPPATQAELDIAGDQAAAEAAKLLGVKR